MVSPPSIGLLFDGVPPLGSSLVVVLHFAQPRHLKLPPVAVFGRDGHGSRVRDKPGIGGTWNSSVRRTPSQDRRLPAE